VPNPIRIAGDVLKRYGLHSRATGLLNQPTTRLGQFVKAVNPFTARNLIEDAILDQAEKIDPDLKTNVVPGPIPLSKGTLYVANPKVGLFADTLIPRNTKGGTLAEEDPETYRKIRAMEAAQAGIERAKERAFGIGQTED
jgi:hypothetical protein